MQPAAFYKIFLRILNIMQPGILCINRTRNVPYTVISQESDIFRSRVHPFLFRIVLIYMPIENIVCRGCDTVIHLHQKRTKNE